MNKFFKFFIPSILLLVSLIIVGSGFSAWYFMDTYNNINSNVDVTCFIDFDYLVLKNLSFPDEIAFEDPLMNKRSVSSTGIFFLKSSSTELDTFVEHSSTSKNCTDILSFSFEIQVDATNKDKIEASDFKCYLGIKVDDIVSDYFDLGGYEYSSSSLGKEISLTKENNEFISPSLHLEEIITYKDKENTFGDAASTTTFLSNMKNVKFSIYINLKENN